MEKSKIIGNGEFEIVKITEDLYDEALEIFKNHFLKYENISIVVNLAGTEQSVREMLILARAALSDGVSFGARDRHSGQLVAININKILNPSANLTFEAVFSGFISPKMHYVGEFLSQMESTYDLYKEWNIDCVLELLFLSTRSDYGKRGLALALSRHCVEFARNMLNGSLTDDERRQLAVAVRDQKPKAITSIFSSLFTQRIGEKLGFEVVHRVQYSDIEFEGQKFSAKVDPMHKESQYAALRL